MRGDGKAPTKTTRKVVVTISRYWDNPKIMTVLSGEGISLTTNLEDFLAAVKLEFPLDDFVKKLAEEIGSVRWIFRNRTFDARVSAALEAKMPAFHAMLDDAFTRTCERIKEESTKAVGS
jgi:hypothetical protein